MIEITGLSSSSGPLTKRISLSLEGKLISDGSACVMSRGRATRMRLGGVTEFAQLIGGLRSDQAIALGTLRQDLPDVVEITTARKLAEMNGSAGAGAIARAAGHIGYVPRAWALALLDYDTKGMPSAVAARLVALGGFWPALLTVLPDLAGVGRVTRRSTGSGIARSDTGEVIPGSDGVHVFVLVQDGADTERFLKALHDRCWLAGLGWMMVGAGGQFLERSIVDRMVFAAERLVFEGAPILHEPLVQDAALRAPDAVEGQSADSRALCPSLTTVEQSRLHGLKQKERYRITAPATAARQRFVKEHGARIAARTGVSVPTGDRVAERQCAGVLLPNVVLEFDAEDLAGCTVADVLADPEKFVGATMADPLEGIAYGRCKAKIMQRVDGSLWINSFAHGRAAYELKRDAASIAEEIGKAPPEEAADVLVRLLPEGDVEADEIIKLRDQAGKLAGLGARPMNAKIKAASTTHERAKAEEARTWAEANRSDTRIRLAAPEADAERLPVVRAIDEALCDVDSLEPPMRDMMGAPVEVRVRPPMLLHELTSVGANAAEDKKTTRLPAPEMPLLSQHDRYSLAHEIERHIEYRNEGRSVALPQGFVDHFLHYRDSRLPRVSGIVTAPLVLPDGRMLATQGLDRHRKLVFRIPPELLALVGDIRRPTPEKVAAALNYLVNDWLCDVATSFTGRCVLITMALTILERVLLPGRPAFFVTAGKRGGGKTTALTLVIMAVTGKNPPAAAWSANEDERRKALLAYLSEGLAAMVFDNIPLGATIACPTIEKILTAEALTDRKLGETDILTVPAYTILSFTGNNISPKGDLASRSLKARLDVDRADPENRPFRHIDPIAYTIENRGKIMRALYTILLGNKQLTAPEQPKTRFKPWWHLVGAAMEHASVAMMEMQTNAAAVGNLHDEDQRAIHLNFALIFKDVEEQDEEAAGIGDALDALRNTWPIRRFTSADVLKLINEPMKGEEAAAGRLKEFFVSRLSGRYGVELTAMKIGHQLGIMVDVPVEYDAMTLKLVKAPQAEGAKRAAGQFFVKVME